MTFAANLNYSKANEGWKNNMNLKAYRVVSAHDKNTRATSSRVKGRRERKIRIFPQRKHDKRFMKLFQGRKKALLDMVSNESANR